MNARSFQTMLDNDRVYRDNAKALETVFSRREIDLANFNRISSVLKGRAKRRYQQSHPPQQPFNVGLISAALGRAKRIAA